MESIWVPMDSQDMLGKGNKTEENERDHNEKKAKIPVQAAR